MDNPYSMNTIDICPVGALTSRDFRFKARVWDMSSTKSICIGCSRGCNTEIWVRNDEILRLTPRLNEEVNSYWMCDHGRLNTFKFVNAEDRIDSPKLMVEGQQINVGWDEAFAEAASRLKAYPRDQVAVLGSAFATCEDNFITAKFAKSVIGTNHLDFIKHVDNDFGDDILKQNDIAPNSLGAEMAGVQPANNGLSINSIVKAIQEKKIKALYIIEDDILSRFPELETEIAALDLLIIHASNKNKTSVYADIIFPAATYAEKNGTMMNFQGRIQRLKPAVSTIESDRALDGMSMSRLDKFGTKFDSWASGKKCDARSTWKILVSLSNAFGIKMKFNMAEDVFTEMSKTINEFKGLNYDDIGENGIIIHTQKVVKEETT